MGTGNTRSPSAAFGFSLTQRSTSSWKRWYSTTSDLRLSTIAYDCPTLMLVQVSKPMLITGLW